MHHGAQSCVTTKNWGQMARQAVGLWQKAEEISNLNFAGFRVLGKPVIKALNSESEQTACVGGSRKELVVRSPASGRQPGKWQREERSSFRPSFFLPLKFPCPSDDQNHLGCPIKTHLGSCPGVLPGAQL